MKRRHFLQHISRYFLLGGLLTAGGFLLSNRKVTPTSNCSFTPVCQRCTQFGSCEKVREATVSAYGEK